MCTLLGVHRLRQNLQQTPAHVRRRCACDPSSFYDGKLRVEVVGARTCCRPPPHLSNAKCRCLYSLFFAWGNVVHLGQPGLTCANAEAGGALLLAFWDPGKENHNAIVEFRPGASS